MAVGNESKPVEWQVADLSPIGAAPTEGVFVTREYIFHIDS